VRLIPYSDPPFDPVPVEHLEWLVAHAFAMRRKTLNNNLKGIINAEQLHSLAIDGGKRPEQISIEEYVKMAKFVSN
jgi:16S rRNA (adenine1518-N6/adenine1519-N6)-dimethyltransferase